MGLVRQPARRVAGACGILGCLVLLGCGGGRVGEDSRHPESAAPGPEASASAGDEPRDEVPSPSGPRISLTRTACLGVCPSYTVTVRPDGRVEYFGHALVAVTGTASGRIEAEQVAALHERLEAIDFFALEDCLDRLDVPQVIVDVEDDERAHRVAVLSGCSGRGVEPIVALAEQIDRIVESRRWVGLTVPCGFAIHETIYFRDGQTALSEASSEVLEDVAEVLRDLEVPVTLVGSHRRGESSQLVPSRTAAVHAGLLAAGVAEDMLAVDPGATVRPDDRAAVRFVLDVPPGGPALSLGGRARPSSVAVTGAGAWVRT